MTSQVWLVTGATSGLGAALVDHLISRGEKVIASGRNVEKRLGHLHSQSLALLEMDISASSAEIQAQIANAWKIFGHVDVLINNAGMSSMRSAEEADEAFVNNIFQVNTFGHMRVTQAALPFFRAQGSGCIGFTSSSSLWAPLPFMSHYAASKAAISTYVEALSKEVRPLGIRCVAFECGGMPTSLGQPRDTSQAGFGSNGPSISAYAPQFNALFSKFVSNPMTHMPGDPAKAAARIFDIAKQEGAAEGKPWAVRVALGSDGMGSAKARCEEQLELVARWRDVSKSVDRDGVDGTLANAELLEFTTVLEN